MDLFVKKPRSHWSNGERINFTWTVKGVSFLRSGSFVRSPVYHPHGSSIHLCSFKLTRETGYDGEDYLSFDLNVSRHDLYQLYSRYIQVELDLEVVGADGSVCIRRDAVVSAYWPESSTIIRNFVTMRELDANILTPAGVLILRVRGQIIGPFWKSRELRDKIESRTSFKTLRDKLGKITLAHDLMRMARSLDFADSTLITRTRSFSVHKSILGARSSVFNAMFKTDMIERSSNSVTIPDFDAETVASMLNYAYRGTAECIGNIAIDVLLLADKYDMQSLKTECELTMCRYLTVENAAEVAYTASLCKADLLMYRVLGFIARNRFDVENSDTFQTFVKMKLPFLIEIYESAPLEVYDGSPQEQT